MGLRYNPFNGSFDFTRSPGSYLDGEVQTFADLPLDTAAAPLNSAWLVREASGLWLVSRKPAGIYIRTATGGTDRSADYTYASAFPDVFSDANFTLYDDADSTKNAKFQLSNITTGQTRTLTVPDASGTLPLLETANTFTANQTLNGTNNVMPNQTTAASGSSIMTRDLVADSRFFSLGTNYRIGTPAFGSSGAGSQASAETGTQIARVNCGTATSGFGRMTLSRSFNTATNLSGGGIQFSGWTLGVALRIGTGFFTPAARDERIRLIVGGNAGTPATADNDALGVVGFGWELRSTATATEWRIFAHNGTAFATSAWSSFSAGNISLGQPLYFAVISNGAGTITGYHAPTGSRTLSTITLTGGPTTGGTATNSYVDLVSVASSTGTPSGLGCVLWDGELIARL